MNHLIRVGPLEVALPDSASREEVSEKPPFTVLNAIVEGHSLEIRHAEGCLDLRSGFVATATQFFRPRGVEKVALTLGGCPFEGARLLEPEAFGPPTGASYTVLVADLFGDFCSFSWGYKNPGPIDPDLLFLYDTMVQGIVVRRQISMGPAALQAWLDARR